jgi:hypothetical protein
MNWIAIIPLVIQGLTAIQPLFGGVNASKVVTTGNELIPFFEKLLGGIAPASQSKVGPAITAATAVFNPDPIKWIQQVLNLAGNNLDVDGEVGPLTLAAADAFAAKELGIVQGGFISVVLHDALISLGTKSQSGQPSS